MVKALFALQYDLSKCDQYLFTPPTLSPLTPHCYHISYVRQKENRLGKKKLAKILSQMHM